MLHKAITQLLYDEGYTYAYSGKVPNGVTLPFINHFVVTKLPTNTKDGPSTVDIIRYQVSCFHELRVSVETLAEAVRQILDDYSGTEEGAVIERIRYESENYIYESNDVHHIAQHYEIRLKRS